MSAQFFLREAATPRDIGFSLALIPARAYGIKIKIAGIRSASCGIGVKDTLTLNWVDQFGSVGSNFIEIAGTPYNRAFATIPLTVSAAPQTFTFKITYTSSTDGSCSKLFISDFSLIVFECDPSCAGCTIATSCSCDYTLNSFLLNTNVCGASCTPDYVNTATSACVSLCGVSEYPHPTTGFCTACPSGCTNCTVTADRFSPSVICLDPVTPSSNTSGGTSASSNP